MRTELLSQAYAALAQFASESRLYEGMRQDDIQLYPTELERQLWKRCLPIWHSKHQDNILNAVKNCIRSADNYIYIETQFFITGFGRWGKHDSTKFGNEDNGILNGVGDELAKRISHHIKGRTPFHVYLVIPAHPEGSPDSGAVWKQQWLAIASIKHGDRSLINQIKKTLEEVGRPTSEWNQYLTVLNMRNFGEIDANGRPKLVAMSWNRSMRNPLKTTPLSVADLAFGTPDGKVKWKNRAEFDKAFDTSEDARQVLPNGPDAEYDE